MKKIYLLVTGLVFAGLSEAQTSSWSWGFGPYLTANGSINTMCNGFGSVYAAGAFMDTLGAYYIAKWNPASGIVALPDSNLPYGSFTVLTDGGNYLYASGQILDSTGSLYVGQWDYIFNQWSQLGPGSNYFAHANPYVNIPQSACSDIQGNLYLSGRFNGAAVVVWNTLTSTWSEVGTNSLALYTANGNIGPYLCLNQYSYPLYSTGWLGDTLNGLFNVSWFGGSGWEEVGTGPNALNANNSILTLCIDPNGNLYAAGNFTDANGTFYVAKWDGNTWSELGTGINALNANNSITSICTDNNGILYATGTFSDQTGVEYVAAWNGVNWYKVGYSTNPLANSGTTPGILLFDTYGYLCLAAVNTPPLYGGNLFEYVPAITVSLNSQAVCEGAHLTLSPSIIGTGILRSFNWTTIAGSPLSCDTCENPTVTINQNSTYLVIVTDQNGDTASASVTYTVESAANYFMLSAINTALGCNLDSTKLSIAWAAYPLTINWADGDVNDSLNHLYTAPGVYSISLSDDYGCSISISDTLPLLLPLLVSEIPAGCGSDSGVLNASSHGGHPPFNYLWSNGDTTAQVTGLAVGNYTLTITDSLGCSTTNSFYVGPFSITLTGVNDICGHNGSISATVAGGTPPYNYLWSNGSTNNIVSNLISGLYVLTVTDSTGCSATTAYNVDSGYYYYYIFLTSTDANCGNTGAVSSNVYGGTSPYIFSWSNGDTAASPQNLGGGIYYVTVTDSNGCSALGNISIPAYCATVISGTVFLDSSGNCILDSSSSAVRGTKLGLNDGNQTIYATTNPQGQYYFVVRDTGTYQISVCGSSSNACNNYIFCNNPGRTIYVSAIGDSLTGNNVAVVPGPQSFDLYIYPEWTSANPGFEKDYYPFYGNYSNVPFTDTAIIAFKYDSNLIFLGCGLPYSYFDSINDTLAWTISNFTRGPNMFSMIRFMVPAGLSEDYMLKNQFWIYPFINDCDTTNNYVEVYQSCIGSKDPNAKTVSPTGPLREQDSVLTYTIYFQNTGTDSTYFIIIKDTLSPYLNPATVRNLASSASYSDFNISGNGILTWTFNPLRIPDSTTNPLTSKGFIMFSVSKNSNVPQGTPISNSASIYFDYNNAVVTDTIVDTAGCIVRDSLNISICNGTVYLFNGNNLSATGTYADTLLSALGCDSIVTLNLTVLPLSNSTISASICSGQSYNGYTTTGNYVDTFTASNGCDSIINLSLTVDSILTTSITQSICAGQTYNGHDSSGVYIDTLFASGGCDSIVTLTLTVNALPVVGFSWDSLAIEGYLYDFFPDSGACLYGINFLTTPLKGEVAFIPLFGANPAGGVYSGIGVINDTLFADTALVDYINNYGYDTITYTLNSAGCLQSVTDVLFLWACEGINDVSNITQLNIKPNPTSGLLNVSYTLSNETNVVLNVLDIEGRRLINIPQVQSAAGGHSTQIDVSKLAAGLYILNFESGGGNLNRKFVKQ